MCAAPATRLARPEQRPEGRVGAARDRFPALDAVRGLAALAIVAFHAYKDMAVRPGWDGPLGTFGYSLQWAVPVFFVLSGFLLYRPFAAAIVSGRDRPAAVPFLVRRAARILPAYWVALAAFGTLTAAGTLWTADGLVRYGLLLQVFSADTVYHVLGTAWSLSMEAGFYLALPVVASLVARGLGERPSLGRHLALLGALTALAIVVRHALLAPAYAALGQDPALVGFVLPGSVEPFAAGMALAALLVSRPEARAAARRAPRLVRLAVVGLGRRDGPWLALALLAYSLGLVVEARHIAPWDSTNLATVAAVALLAPLVFRPSTSRLARVLGGSRPLAALGAISYGLYLWHWPIQEVVRTHGLAVDHSIAGWAAGFAVIGTLGLLAAIASDRLIERPINARVRAALAEHGPRPRTAAARGPSAASTRPSAETVGGLESGAVAAHRPRPAPIARAES